MTTTPATRTSLIDLIAAARPNKLIADLVTAATRTYTVRFTGWTSEFVEGVGIVFGTAERVFPCKDAEHAERELQAAFAVQDAHNIPRDAQIV